MKFRATKKHDLDNNCIQTIVRFDSGYGASILRGGAFAYGGLELAVLKEDEYGMTICYDSPITDDVIGHLTEDEVSLLLEKISKLT